MESRIQKFPLNIIDYPAFYPQDYCDNFSSIVRDEYFVNNLPRINGTVKEEEKENKFHHKTLVYPPKMKKIRKYENTFDMHSIITPNEETSKFYAKKVRKNTTKSLIQHNLEKEKEIETLNQAKQKFIEIQQQQKRGKMFRYRQKIKASIRTQHYSNETSSESRSPAKSASPVITEIDYFNKS